MSNKIGIGIEAQLDTSAVEQRINAFGQKVAQANKVQFTPISVKALDDLETARKRFEQLLKVHGELNRRVKATGQAGKSPWEMDFGAMFPNQGVRARKMLEVMQYTFGGSFTAPPGAPPPGRQPHQPAVPGWGTVGMNMAQAGLRAAGPVGNVAAGAVGTGMSAGFGAGLMGLMGGMLALGVGKLVGAVTEKIGQAEDQNVALDRLKRTLGDVNVSFNALKSVVHGSADNLKITYQEAGQLATQFAKLGNVSGDRYKDIGDELRVGVGFSRAFGLDPSQGVGVLGGMRGVGLTSNVQDSRRMALLIGETIAKSDAFAKADEVMEAIAGYATMQTRSGMGAANVAGFAGMFAGLAGSGIPGLDPAGAGALLGRVNSSLTAGGAKGEASQFFTAMVGQRMGLDPIQTQILREGGAFATNDEAFGSGSIAARFGIRGPGGNKTFLQGSMDLLRQQYGGNKGLLAQATANHLGVNMRQAMALLSVDPKQMGELQGFANLGELSGNGIANLAKARFGSAAERQALASEYLGRTGSAAISSADRQALLGAGGDDGKLRDVLTQMASRYDQERTMGSDIRDSKAALDNIKTNLADKMVPYLNEMRHGIMFMAGVKDGKSPKDIMEAVMRAESKDRQREIRGGFDGQLKDAASAPGRIRASREEVLNELRRGYGTMSEEERAAKQRRVQQLTEELDNAEAEARRKVIELMGKKEKALQEEIDKLESTVKEMREASPLGISPVALTTGSISGAGGGRGFVNPANAASGGSLSAGDPGTVNAAMKFFMDKGWSREQAAGIVANLVAESGMRPGAVGDGGAAYGIAQWHPDRQANFQRWAGKNIQGSSFEDQLGFVHYEMTEGAEKAAGDRLRGTRTAGEAGDVVSRHYERPKFADAEASKRADLAARIGNTPLPAEAAGGGASPALRVSADDITVRIVDRDGKPMQPPQMIPTRVTQATPFGGGASGSY